MIGDDTVPAPGGLESLAVLDSSHLERLLDSIPAGIAVLNAEGRLLAANRIWRKASLASDQAVGPQDFRTVLRTELGGRESVESLLQGIGEVLAGRRNAFETELPRRAAGEKRWVLLRASPCPGVGGCLLTAFDITSRKRAEERMRFQAQLLDSVRESVVATDLDGYVTYWGKGAERLYGYAAEEALGRKVTFVAPPGDEAAEEERMRQVMENGFWRGVYEQRRRDGSTFLAETMITLARDESGQPFGFIGIDLDITESEAKYRLLFDQVPVSIWEQDFSEVKRRVDEIVPLAGGDLRGYFEARPGLVRELAGLVRVIDVNRATLELYAATSKEELFRGIPYVFSEESFHNFINALLVVAEGGRWLTTEVAHRRLDGELLRVQLRWRVAPGCEEDYSRVLVSINDVTDLEGAREAALAASRAKSEFLANMSHEVRTPLSGIMGMLQLLKITELSEEQQEYVGNALLSSRNLNTILTDILDLSKIEAGQMEIEETAFDVRDVLNEVYGNFIYQFEEKGLLLVLEVHPDTPERLLGDPARLRQVLFNLVGNAVKFTDSGGVTVSVSPLQAPGPDGGDRLPHLHGRSGRSRMLFTVSDSGSGMPDEAVGRVFDAFTQADGPYDKKKQGTGLGLRIVKEFVHLMGGSLAVANQEGEGLTMYFTVDLGVEAPAEARAGSAAQTEQANPAPEAPPAREALRGHRLLVVDDDPLSRTTLSQMLRKSGYEVSVAEGGREALERLRETEHDLVLMDIKMPDMDGVQATRRIHKMYQESQSSPPPIVAMTAHAMRGDREAFLDAGLDDYLAKPVLWEELADLLDNHLNRDPESGPSKGEARP